MRVLILNRYLGFRSGVEKFVYDLARALDRRGHTVNLVFEEDRKDPVRYASAFRECVRLPLYGGDRDGLAAEILARTGTDVVFAHNARDASWVARFAATVPTVQMVHDHEVFCLNGKKYFYLTTQHVCDKPVGLPCYARCTGLRRSGNPLVPVQLASLDERRTRLRILQSLPRVLVCSFFMKRELVRNGLAPERVLVLPVFVNVPPEPEPYRPESRLVVFVGRINREKGLLHLLRALTLVPEEWRAAVVGEGDVSQARKSAEDLGIAGRVTFHGFLPFNRIRELYREAALVAMPSVWPEPLGMVGLEAMAHARPVVAYDTGGIPDWLVHGETGVLVPRRDIRALASAIGELLRDRELAGRMGREGHARVAASRYVAGHFVDRFAELVASLGVRDPDLSPASLVASDRS